MFNDDEDFGFLTGGIGDLDGDSDVDFVEYMNEEDDFQRIMGGDDDFSVLDDDEDIEMLTEAEELGIDPDDYIDNDELKQALEDYKQIIDSVDYYTDLYNNSHNEYSDEEFSAFDDSLDEENNTIYLPDGFDISKLSLTIGAETSLNYDGKPIDQVFLNPEKEKSKLDDEYFANSDTAGEISREEYKKLKNENKALKSKITQLENRITDLNYCIQRLEKDLDAKRKVKEWDGKYYRYCKVVMDESPNGLWYRTDDITLKKGDYVYVPYGYKNEELMAKVVLVEEFRSDDLPVPLYKMKFIIEKCDA